MRQIYPIRSEPGVPGGQESQADPLRSLAQITPSAAAEPGVGQLVAALAASYAYPDGIWVRANMVASVDGAIALEGRSGGLSGPADRLVFWVLRSLADVIVVGAGTARAEQYGQVPAAELWPGLRGNRRAIPPIAVITRRLDLDLEGRLFARTRQGVPESARTIILTTSQAPDDRVRAAGQVADVIVAGERDVTAAAAIDALAGLGHHRILTEGGPRLLGQLAAGGLLDELCLTVSPVLEGGHAPAGVMVAPDSAAVSPAGPTAMRLGALFEDDGFLFGRYLRASRA